MKALLIATAVFAFPALAFADDVTGTIRGIDTQQFKMGLDNGKVYSVDPTIQLNKFKPGDKVTVSFSAPDAGLTADGVAGVATQITIAK